MYCVKKMTEDLYWVGASERRLNLFENAYPLTNGVSYNSYLLLDEKTVLIDTVDKSVSGLFFENVDHVLSAGSSTISSCSTWSPTTPRPSASSSCATPS